MPAPFSFPLPPLRSETKAICVPSATSDRRHCRSPLAGQLPGIAAVAVAEPESGWCRATGRVRSGRGYRSAACRPGRSAGRPPPSDHRSRFLVSVDSSLCAPLCVVANQPVYPSMVCGWAVISWPFGDIVPLRASTLVRSSIATKRIAVCGRIGRPLVSARAQRTARMRLPSARPSIHRAGWRPLSRPQPRSQIEEAGHASVSSLANSCRPINAAARWGTTTSGRPRPRLAPPPPDLVNDAAFCASQQSGITTHMLPPYSCGLPGLIALFYPTPPICEAQVPAPIVRR